MVQWSYIGVDILTGAVLADLPLAGASFSRVLNGYGTLTGSLPLHGLPRPDDVVDAVQCGMRAVYALADGAPVWGGPVWDDPDDGADVLNLSAAEWGAYFMRRVIRTSRTFTSVDQLTVAQTLLADAQAVSGGNVRVAVGTETSGVTRTISYLPGNMPVVGEQIDNLAALSNGFDVAWPVEFDSGGLPRGRMLLGYPRLGASTVSYVVDVPGIGRVMPLDRSAQALATTAWAVGKANNGVANVTSTTDTTMLTAGYPVYDAVNTYSDVTDPAILQAHSDADQAAAGGPLLHIKVTVPIGDVLGATPAVGLGDPVRVERFLIRDGADGFVDSSMRVTQIDYAPETQTADLTLTPRITNGGRIMRVRGDRERIAKLARQTRILAVTA